jgi:hypothetical protein
LEKIYSGNFRAAAGDAPAEFDTDAAVAECERIAGIAKDPSQARTASGMIKASR